VVQRAPDIREVRYVPQPQKKLSGTTRKKPRRKQLDCTKSDPVLNDCSKLILHCLRNALKAMHIKFVTSLYFVRSPKHTCGHLPFSTVAVCLTKLFGLVLRYLGGGGDIAYTANRHVDRPKKGCGSMKKGQ
jgi:hypothetical protein